MDESSLSEKSRTLGSLLFGTPCDDPSKLTVVETPEVERINPDYPLAFMYDFDRRLYGRTEADEKMNQQLWPIYNQQVEESEGFDIEDWPRKCVLPIVPFTGCHNVDHINGLATLALQNFEHGEYELDKVITVNMETDAGYRYYITFLAKKAGADLNDPPVTFQARVWDHRADSQVEVELCRIKSSP